MEVPLLAVLDVGQMIDEGGMALPTVVVDAAEHPSVSDLARVHATEGIGDIRTELVRAGNLALLGVKLTSPVEATFALALELDHDGHRQVLVDAAAAGSLVIAHTDPTRAATDRPLWLAIDIDGEPLLAAIGVARRPTSSPE